MTIFVGSRTEKRAVAEKIAMVLKTANLRPLPWWDTTVFRAGHVTLKELIDLSEKCDGAVFVFGEDDEVFAPDRSWFQRWSRSGETTFVPRDNVLVEFGIFVARHGPERTFVYREGRVKDISDLRGITYVTANDYATKLVDGFRAAQRKLFGKSVHDRLMLYVTTRLEECMAAGTIPLGWHARAMYMGSRGAIAWADVESAQSYSGRHRLPEVANTIREMVSRHRLNDSSSIVSFGPGVGILDAEVVPSLVGNEPAKYIPVDINDHLAMRAAAKMDAHPDVSVPFCIVADFEEDMSTIAELVKDHTTPRRVFMMLGGTFGNIETSENAFLHRLRACMDEGDTAMLDVFVATALYDINKDRYHDVDRLPREVRQFLATGVERRTGVLASSIVDRLSSCVSTRKHAIRSDISTTATFDFICTHNNAPVSLIYVRRYNFDAFRTHLQGLAFEVIDSKSVGDPGDLLHRGVFLIRKV